MSDTDFENNTPICNYQALALHIIYSAVLDIAKRDSARRLVHKKSEALRAVEWLNGGPAMFPCALACDIMNIDIHSLRRRIADVGELYLDADKLHMPKCINSAALRKMADSMQRAALRIIDHRGGSTNEKIDEYDNDCI